VILEHSFDIESIAPAGIGDIIFMVCAKDIQGEFAGPGEDAGPSIGPPAPFSKHVFQFPHRQPRLFSFRYIYRPND